MGRNEHSKRVKKRRRGVKRLLIMTCLRVHKIECATTSVCATTCSRALGQQGEQDHPCFGAGEINVMYSLPATWIMGTMWIKRSYWNRTNRVKRKTTKWTKWKGMRYSNLDILCPMHLNNVRNGVVGIPLKHTKISSKLTKWETLSLHNRTETIDVRKITNYGRHTYGAVLPKENRPSVFVIWRWMTSTVPLSHVWVHGSKSRSQSPALMSDMCLCVCASVLVCFVHADTLVSVTKVGTRHTYFMDKVKLFASDWLLRTRNDPRGSLSRSHTDSTITQTDRDTEHKNRQAHTDRYRHMRL